MRNLALQFWTLAGPYWRSSERWRSGAILLAVVVLNLGSVYITVLINLWYALFYNALQDRDFPAFSYQILRFGGLAAIYIFAGVYQTYLRQMLQIRWRNWLTQRYVARWLQNDAYYHLQLSSDGTDNPDQRIQEDINGFVGQTLILGLGLLESVVTLGSFAAILWGLSGTLEIGGLAIPGYMLWAAIIYSILGTWLTNAIGRPLVRLNYQQQQYEANLRFSLVRLRENAEGIALYGGEETELKTVVAQFANVVTNWWGIMRRQKLLRWFSSGYTQIAIIFPFVVAAPRYFAGAFQLGELIQTAQAFGQVQTALSWFVTSYTDLADWKATVNRLAGFERALAETGERERKGLSQIEIPGGRTLTVSKANIYLPDGSPLLTDLNFQLPAGSRILVSGASGAGKSTLLRTLSGIWPYCDGSICLPLGDRTMFFPQKPYLPLGTLRDAVCYPDAPSSHAKKDVKAALEMSGMGAFASRLEEQANWALQLSPGEQQRMAFARALLLRPRWLFLDEATSALDEDSEAMLYPMILENLKGCAVISVAHRKSLVRYHDSQIVISKQAGAGQPVLQALG
jgi:vitamin B12/bleomycin/antimicrobial peptide transport system ATP-binding/permease protein